jgi:predicted DNA-binding protein with PD1-like motif
MSSTARFTLALLFVNASAFCQQSTSIVMKKYIQVPAGYVMVLRQGDNVFDELKTLATTEKIPSAHLSGMGFVHVTFGFFDFKEKKYNPKDFKDVELASMLGTIAWKDGEVSIHAHGVAGDKTFHTYGGHILDAQVSTGSVEILITLHPQRLERKRDEALGADVLDIDPQK